MDVAQLKTASFITSLQCLLHRLYIIFDFTVNSLYYLFPKGYFNKVITLTEIQYTLSILQVYFVCTSKKKSTIEVYFIHTSRKKV